VRGIEGDGEHEVEGERKDPWELWTSGHHENGRFLPLALGKVEW
jgi:hypothetical protein